MGCKSSKEVENPSEKLPLEKRNGEESKERSKYCPPAWPIVSELKVSELKLRDKSLIHIEDIFTAIKNNDMSHAY
jgi:hypothetical protein